MSKETSWDTLRIYKVIVNKPILIEANILHGILIVLVTPQKQFKKERLINSTQVLLLHFRVAATTNFRRTGIPPKLAELHGLRKTVAWEELLKDSILIGPQSLGAHLEG